MSTWKACFDESLDGQQAVECVVGGLILSQDGWDTFYGAWRDALAIDKFIPYYSSKDGGRRDREDSVFFGWTNEEVAAKRRRLAKVVRDHSERHVAVACFIPDFDAAMASGEPLPRDRYDDPYLPCFATAMQAVAKHMSEVEASGAHALPLSKPAIVFDTPSSPKLKGRVLGLWHDYRLATPSQPLHEVSKWLQDQPSFKEDKIEEPGLQAADFIASAYRDARDRVRKRIPGATVAHELGDKLLGNSLTPHILSIWKSALANHIRQRIGE